LPGIVYFVVDWNRAARPTGRPGLHPQLPGVFPGALARSGGVASDKYQPRGRKSGLPPRSPGTGILPRLELPRSKERFRGYIDFLTREVMTALRRASSSDSKSREGPASARSPQVFPVEEGVECEIFNDVILEHDLNTKLQWAVQEYLFAHKYALDPTQFRRELLSFERRVNALHAEIPNVDSALSMAIGGAARAIDQSTGVEENSEASSLEEQVGLDNLRDRIGALSQILRIIRSQEQGRGRDANRAAHQFVETLAQIFTEYTGHEPSRSNSPSHQWVDAINGPFGNFVTAVNRQLPRDSQLTDIDNFVRHVVSRRRAKSTKKP
jgi:hypothetical protein